MSSFQSTSTTAQHQPSQQSQNNDHTTSSPSGATKAIGGLRRLASDPQQLNAYMDVIERLENTFRNTAHTSISQIIPQGGFQHLEVDSEVQIARGCKLDIAVKFMERKLQSVLDKGAREHIDDFLLMLEGATESYQMYSLHILVDAGNGEARLVVASFQRRSDGRYDFSCLRSSGTFKLAATMVIRTHYRKSFMHEKRFDSIEYIPANMTYEQANQLILFLSADLYNTLIRTMVPLLQQNSGSNDQIISSRG